MSSLPSPVVSLSVSAPSAEPSVFQSVSSDPPPRKFRVHCYTRTSPGLTCVFFFFFSSKRHRSLLFGSRQSWNEHCRGCVGRWSSGDFCHGFHLGVDFRKPNGPGSRSRRNSTDYRCRRWCFVGYVLDGVPERLAVGCWLRRSSGYWYVSKKFFLPYLVTVCCMTQQDLLNIILTIPDGLQRPAFFSIHAESSTTTLTHR